MMLYKQEHVFLYTHTHEHKNVSNFQTPIHNSSLGCGIQWLLDDSLYFPQPRGIVHSLYLILIAWFLYQAITIVLLVLIFNHNPKKKYKLLSSMLQIIIWLLLPVTYYFFYG